MNQLMERAGLKVRSSRGSASLYRPLTSKFRIVDFLDRETARIDALVAKIETAIERLREHRTALITAAVTGKIDVRGTVVREEDSA